MTEINPPASVPSGLSTGEDVDQLLHPARFYARPANVVADELLTIDERRAILSSWASDACAVDSDPTLRQSPFAPAPVTFDEIMDALLQLDRMKRQTGIAGVERYRRPQFEVPSYRREEASDIV
jgi:hypothetical protein